MVGLDAGDLGPSWLAPKTMPGMPDYENTVEGLRDRAVRAEADVVQMREVTEHATALAEKYGEAIVRIGEALARPNTRAQTRLIIIRTIIAALIHDKQVPALFND